uniref:Uncharacterized protein n=1 Tax=Oryza brachyantha TaxID=4533 RepID=J3M7J2_ORYBR
MLMAAERTMLVADDTTGFLLFFFVDPCLLTCFCEMTLFRLAEHGGPEQRKMFILWLLTPSVS